MRASLSRPANRAGWLFLFMLLASAADAVVLEAKPYDITPGTVILDPVAKTWTAQQVTKVRLDIGTYYVRHPVTVSAQSTMAYILKCTYAGCGYIEVVSSDDSFQWYALIGISSAEAYIQVVLKCFQMGLCGKAVYALGVVVTVTQAAEWICDKLECHTDEPGQCVGRTGTSGKTFMQWKSDLDASSSAWTIDCTYSWINGSNYCIKVGHTAGSNQCPLTQSSGGWATWCTSNYSGCDTPTGSNQPLPDWSYSASYPVPPSQFYDVITDVGQGGITEEQWRDIVTSSGAPASEIPEFQGAADGAASDLDAQMDDDPNTNPDTNRDADSKDTQILQDILQELRDRNDDDTTFTEPSEDYDSEIDQPEKKELSGLWSEILAGLLDYVAASNIDVTDGECTIPFSVTLGGKTVTRELSFCEYTDGFNAAGSFLLAFAYILAQVIVIRDRAS